MYWWKKLLFVSSYKVCFLFQNFVSCSVSYNINWIVTQIGFFPGPHTCSKALTGVGRGITSPFHGDFYFNFHLSWLMCKSWMLQRLEKLICLVRSFSMSCDIFDLHICQDRWKLENWCLLLTQVDCRVSPFPKNLRSQILVLSPQLPGIYSRIPLTFGGK